ncbi:MAG: CBS domain-containing protein [Candidatus Aenigmarchaeota archaeon]|nr:CBS domain-containing protein [Candidatus Aenigmarchaeota archaeon]
MLIKDVMRTNVITIKPRASVREAAEIMTKNKIGSLIVISPEGRAVGIITGSDIITDLVAIGGNSEDVTVEEIMSSDIITISPNDTLEEAAEIMAENRIKKLPVIDENGMLAGIVTASDLIAFEKRLVEKISELIVSPEVRKIGG